LSLTLLSSQLETVISCVKQVDEEKTKIICKNYAIAEPEEDNMLYEIVLEDTILFPEGGGQVRISFSESA